MIWGKLWIGKKKKESLPFILSLGSEFLSGWSAGWSSTSCNVPTFIRFLASNVREETWSASIVRNERDFLRWNGWPSHGTIRSSKQWSTIYASLSSYPPDGKGNPCSEKSIQLSKFLLSYPVLLDFFNMNIFDSNFSLDSFEQKSCWWVYKKIK